MTAVACKEIKERLLPSLTTSIVVCKGKRHPEGMSQIPMSQKDDLGVKEVLESQYVPKNAKQHIVTTKYTGTIKIDRNAFSFPVNGEIVEYLEEREYSYDFSPEVDTELIKNIIFEIAKTIATSL